MDISINENTPANCKKNCTPKAYVNMYTISIYACMKRKTLKLRGKIKKRLAFKFFFTTTQLLQFFFP